MGVVRREGKWTLEKEKDGKYSINKRGKKKAEIITDDYEPPQNPLSGGVDPMIETIEVKDFKGAKRAFKNYIEKIKKSPLGF